MKERILRYIQEFGSITTKEAFDDLGCTRLAEYIRQLRLEYNIADEWLKGKNRFGETTHYKKYWLEEEVKNDN